MFRQQANASIKFPMLAVLCILLPIPILIWFIVWAGMSVNKIEGPTLLALDSSENVYIIEGENLLVSDSRGNLIGRHTLKPTYSINEPLTDIYATREGNVIFGLRRRNEIREYTQEGGPPLIYKITPSTHEFHDYGHYFHFAMHEPSGTLYVTDSKSGALMIYDSFGKLLRELRTPSGNPPSIKQVSGENIDSIMKMLKNMANLAPDIEKRKSADYPYNWPNAVIVKDGSVYVADTNNFRIIRMDLNGGLQDIILADPIKLSGDGRITSFSVHGGKLYALFKNTVLEGGSLVAIDRDIQSMQRFSPPSASFDPSDIVASSEAVLVSDPGSFSIYAYSHDGRLIGSFGEESLRDELSKPLLIRKTMLLSRYAAIGLIATLLILLAMINERYKKKIKNQLRTATETAAK